MGVKEKFLISLRTRQAARFHTVDFQPCRSCGCPDALNRAFMQRGIANNAAGADIATVQFKLRLDEDQVFSAGSGG